MSINRKEGGFDMQKKITSIRLLPILLILLFSVLSLMTLLSGIGVYKSNVESASRNNQARASLFYVTNKVRAADSDTLRIEQRSGISVLLFTDTIEEIDYETMIYCYNGSLCEMFSRRGRSFQPENGTEIIPISSFEASLEKSLLTLRIEDDTQKVYETKLALK